MAEPMQWEYYVETIGKAWTSTKDEDLMSKLGELGQASWEVFVVEQLRNSSKVRVVAKRPLAPPFLKKHSWP
jgi:hypothetical protein